MPKLKITEGNLEVFEILNSSCLGLIIYLDKFLIPPLLNLILKQYVYNGKFEIDNNNIENALRPLAIGRKLPFAGSHESAQNIAIFYSFFATCKAHDINPYTWLCDVLNRIPEHKANKLHELLPKNWKESKDM